MPAANRLGREGRAAQIFNDSMEWERSCILAFNLGTQARLLDSSIRYCRERQQYGQSIGKFQAVAGRLVDMKLRLEASRLLLYRAAWAKERGQDAGLWAALSSSM